jgi:hypothetical protein
VAKVTGDTLASDFLARFGGRLLFALIAALVIGVVIGALVF